MATSDFIEVSQFGAFVSQIDVMRSEAWCYVLTDFKIFFGAVTTVGVIWVYFFVSSTRN